MLRQKSVFGAIVSFAFFLSAGLACAGTTITFLVDNAPYMVAGAEALAKVYMDRNPGVTVDVETRVAGSEGDNIIKTRLATGEMTDVFIYNSGSLMQALNPDKTLLDLSDLDCQKGVLDSFRQVVTYNGKIYGVPFGTTQSGGIFYHKPTYDKLGLSIPKTWAEFLANCDKVKESGLAAPVAQTYRETWTSQITMLADYYNVQSKVPDFAERYTANKAKFATTPEALRGFEKLRDIHAGDYANEDYGAANYFDGLHMLATGEATHYPILSYAIGAWKQNNPEELKTDIRFYALPGDDASDNGLTLWMPSAAYIPLSSKNIEEAKKFVEFMASTEGGQLYMTVNGAQGPPLIEGCTLPADTPPSVVDMLPYFDSGKVIPALEFLSPIKGPSLEQITVEVGSGMRSPADAAALYDEDVRKQAKQLGIPGW